MIQSQLPALPPSPSPVARIGGGDGALISVGQNANQALLQELMATKVGLQGVRNEIEAQLRQLATNPRARALVDQQVAQLDQRIAGIDQMIAGARNAPPAEPEQIISVPPPYTTERALPKDVFALAGMFMFVVLLPLSVAVALRILRRGAAKVAALPLDIAERLGRMETAIEATAIEVERVGEGQRYLTRVLAERTAEPLELPRNDARERIAAP